MMPPMFWFVMGELAGSAVTVIGAVIGWTYGKRNR